MKFLCPACTGEREREHQDRPEGRASLSSRGIPLNGNEGSNSRSPVPVFAEAGEATVQVLSLPAGTVGLWSGEEHEGSARTLGKIFK